MGSGGFLLGATSASGGFVQSFCQLEWVPEWVQVGSSSQPHCIFHQGAQGREGAGGAGGFSFPHMCWAFHITFCAQALVRPLPQAGVLQFLQHGAEEAGGSGVVGLGSSWAARSLVSSSWFVGFLTHVL